MNVTSRGRFYENGPYTYCGKADVHPQPCLCASKYFPAMRREILDQMARDGEVAGIYRATGDGSDEDDGES